MVQHAVFRGVMAAALALAGWPLGLWVGERVGDPGYVPWGLALTLFGLVLGTLVAPYLLVYPVRWALRKLKALPTSTLALGVAGLLVGLSAAALLSVSLGRVPGAAGWVVPIVVSLALGGLGTLLFIARGKTLAEQVPALRQSGVQSKASNGMILVDTSAIIDGRITDVVAAGFLQGTLGVPRFILDELRRIADSSDVLRRNRGRRGLEVLNQLRQDSKLPLQILDVDGRDRTEVDVRLVSLARDMGAAILTTDFNLNRVAELQGVRVLNLNALANAVKPLVLSGEEMSVRVIQEGREAGQGVGFLDDGTMVVVEGGKRHINTHLDVTVIRILPTTAGRIIFAQPKGVQ
jgi:uncharacterized protein YacL